MSEADIDVDDPIVDPALDDPAMAFLTSHARPATSSASSRFSSVAPSPTDGDNDDESQLGDAGRRGEAQAATGPGLPGGVDPRVFGQMMMKRLRLTPQSEADLARFCEAPSPYEHIVMTYCLGLELRDLLSSRKVTEEWKPSDSLKKTLQKYAHAFVLSPVVSSYRGNASKHILLALRDLKIANLPSEAEDGQVQIVYTIINKSLTTFRNQVKKAIQSSVTEGSQLRNIAHLAEALVQKTKVPVTLQFYLRLAFLRWHVVQFPNLAEEEFWPKVDDTLSKWRTNCKTAVELSNSFNAMYNQDKLKYGHLSDTTVIVTDMAKVDNCQRVLDTHASNVQNTLASDQKLKRKR